MKILLPPSETKRPGGAGAPLDLDRLVLPELRPQRELVCDALVALAEDPTESSRVLKLSSRQQGDIADNRALRTAPTMPAAERYTGVLYDALGYETLNEDARVWLGGRVWIQTAVLGPVSALDLIPAYRLAAGTSLPTVPALRRIWAETTSAAISDASPGFALDLRSEAYAALGPLSAELKNVYLRVVTEAADGAVRALNHFNKKAKGELVRAFATSGADIESLDELLAWLSDHGFRSWPSDDGLELFLQV